MTSWLYIAGRGHSGSTMLDAMLGNAEGIESVGELVSGMGRFEALCSCGEAFKDCPYWKAVRQRYEEDAHAPWRKAVQALAGQAHLKAFFRTMTAVSSAGWIQKLKRHNDHIAHAIASSDHSIVVDSSKEVTRALFLQRFVAKAKILHLVRHSENILQSHYYRLEKGTGFKFLRFHFHPKQRFGPLLLLSAIGWMVGNLLLEIVRCFGRKRFMRFRYEDLITHPERELDRIEQFIGVPLDLVKRKIKAKEAFAVGHNIGGNQMRMSGSFRFDPRKSSRAGLPKRYSVMVHLICWPLLWFYGYYRE